MLTITIPGVESFNNSTQMFVTTDDVQLTLEHSLVSLSKWESKWEKPFLSDEKKTTEEVYSYIQCMTLEGNSSMEVLLRITDANQRDINDYIESKMTATWFRENAAPRIGRPEVVTAEIIYHWIVALQIDWECQYWHLNRLITLVKTINEKNKAASDTKRKAPTSADLANRRALMDQRRAASAAANG